jgi:hypothetical protein
MTRSPSSTYHELGHLGPFISGDCIMDLELVDRLAPQEDLYSRYLDDIVDVLY